VVNGFIIDSNLDSFKVNFNEEINYMRIGIKALMLLGFFYPSCHGGEAGILPVLVSPRSKKTYLRGGTVLGAGSNLFHAGGIEVLGAIPLAQ